MAFQALSLGHPLFMCGVHWLVLSHTPTLHHLGLSIPEQGRHFVILFFFFSFIHCLETPKNYLAFKIQSNEQILQQKIFLLLIFPKEVNITMFIY